VHPIGFIIRLDHDAQPSEHQIEHQTFLILCA